MRPRPGPQMGTPADSHLEEECRQMRPGPWMVAPHNRHPEEV
jgi:hypothetical protein